MYTSQDGYVYRTDNFNSKNVISKFGRNANDNDLVAVVKKIGFIGNDLAGNEVNF